VRMTMFAIELTRNHIIIAYDVWSILIGPLIPHNNIS